MINILLCDDDKALCKSFEADIREYFFCKITFTVGKRRIMAKRKRIYKKSIKR